MTGVFLSFLLYLGTLPTPAESEQAQPARRQPEQPPKPRFDFYTLLPEQTIDVDVEPAEVAKPRASLHNTAPRLICCRPALSASGKTPTAAAPSCCYWDWNPRSRKPLVIMAAGIRVYLGPFESHSTMAKARSLTAGQNIDTLLLKRSKP